MSPHDPKVIYAAANKVFRSSDRGLSWVAISSDLTESPPRDEIVTMGVKNSETQIARNDGIQAWPTIVAFAESPKRAGLLYAGTDDGNLAVSRDGGKRWANIFNKVPGVPKGIWVSEVVPSRFEEGTVYATFDGHRQNDFDTYIYASNDSGETWRSIASNLKGEIARTLTEDVKHPDVLYLGTETGLFVSIDMAMEVHDLHRRGTEIANVIGALNRQITEIAGTIGGKSDVPADVKASFDAFQKELTSLVQKVTPPAGGRGGGGGGGGRGGPDPSVLGRIGQAKNGLMAGMTPSEQTTRAYNDAKTETPKAIADVSALLTKATALSGTLAKYNITLTVPPAPKSTSPSALK